MTRIVTLFAAALVCVLRFPCLAADWPQWMGETRDGVWRETGIVEKFPEGGPAIKWRVPINGGYAGPAVAGGRVYVMDYIRSAGDAKPDPNVRSEVKGTERILCLNAAVGQEIWKYEYDCPYKFSYASGPRCTPTVHGGKVYTLGAEGNLFCLDAEKGKVLWSHDLKKEYKAETPQYGFTGHPLVDGDKLICLVGGPGSVAVAFDKNTGKEIWKALTAKEPGYSPPTIIEAGGQRQLLIWHAEAINSLDPESGKEYWSVPLKPMYGMSIMAPRKFGDHLFAGGIGEVSVLLKLAKDKPAAEVVWRGDNKSSVYCVCSTPIVDDDGTMYGVCQRSQLRGIEFTTGNRLWETLKPTTGDRPVGSGTAFLVKNGDRYFLFSEKGDLIIARLSPKGYEEISRTHLLEPTSDAFGRLVVWSHPAFAQKCIFARNDKEIVCASLAKE
ncbi:MAG: PQQ-binding-like beta-propeller repeat protein [Pirellulaceae bacterium]